MRGIRRENARPGVGVIRTQSRESRNPERGRKVKIGFLDADKVDRMGREKNPEIVRGGEEAGGAEGHPGARDGGRRAEGGDIEWADGG